MARFRGVATRVNETPLSYTHRTNYVNQTSISLT